MTITQIQYFLSAAETLNFTKTANSLHVSQQVVSYQIQTLEKYLGVQLFQREKSSYILPPTDSFSMKHGTDTAWKQNRH